MKVLVINCGSSSLKYQLIDMEGEKVLCKGLCERIGMESSMITSSLHLLIYSKFFLIKSQRCCTQRTLLPGSDGVENT